ncbi:nitrate ABC transporter substrate-binding protein [Burkholderia sp. Leaf177]|uniref:ABC transporter substrate-binding protein n=1 Tax=Burkholderia sp. Leaf177 TaxID=1736287 RepID=UPI000701668E|nr:ABC transporter substrate-binding protein [Burkholderia sp. Leaf177]KQR77131.1 nitrate ABC transporter substrate-binding protein [Burkholderia sp. Leaf177]
MRVKIKLAVRDWDYLTPLALGDVQSERLEVEVHRMESVQDWTLNNAYDAGEVSFSKFVQGISHGGYPLECIPHFLMRGFRQRCILTRTDSDVVSLEQLAGKRVGVTGWADSGNTWTRTLLRRVGVSIDDVRWFAGRLSADDPVFDRLGKFAEKGHIEAVSGERPLTALMDTGELDALFTPFLPSEFMRSDTKLRFLLSDFRKHEVQYFHDVGYVPGIHLLGIKRDLTGMFPTLVDELSELLDESARLWREKRVKYQDTTPWLIDDIVRTSRDLPLDWNANGLEHNEKMIGDFALELFEQRIIDRPIEARAVFQR